MNMWLVGALFVLSLALVIAGLIISRRGEEAGGREDAVSKFIEDKFPKERRPFVRAWVDFITGADKVKPRPAPSPPKQPEELAAQVQELMEEEKSKGGDQNYQWHEIFRVVRHDNGSVAIRLQGQYYPNIAAIEERMQRETITELFTHLGATSTIATAPTTTEKIALKVGDRFYGSLAEIPDTQQRELVKMLLLGAEAAQPPSGSVEPASKPAFKFPSISLSLSKGKTEEPVLTLPARGFLVEIQEILNRRISETPDYASGEIQIKSSAAGELEIHTRYGVFRGIDEVTDFEIRKLIAEAVQEWEKRAEVGAQRAAPLL